MNRTLARALTIGAMVAAVAFVGAPAAVASPITPSTWTVSPGGSYTGSAASITLIDITAASSGTCTSPTVAGTLNTSASGSPATLGSITAFSVGSCPPTPGVTYTMTATMPWNINGVTYDPATGVTTGTVTNIKVHIAVTTVLGTCSGDATGTMDATYTNSTDVLTIDQAPGSSHVLTFSNVKGGLGNIACAGQVHNGDTAAIDVDYTLSPGQTITGM
jgi:hypothetical protein